MKIFDTTPFKIALAAASITTIGIVAVAITPPNRRPEPVQCIERAEAPPPAPHRAPPPPPEPEPPIEHAERPLPVTQD